MKRFPFTPGPPTRLGAGDSARLAEFKARLLQLFAWDQAADLPQTLVRQALNDAESIAILTPHPELVLPTLAEEKLQDIRSWHKHQTEVRRQTEGFQSFAA